MTALEPATARTFGFGALSAGDRAPRATMPSAPCWRSSYLIDDFNISTNSTVVIPSEYVEVVVVKK